MSTFNRVVSAERNLMVPSAGGKRCEKPTRDLGHAARAGVRRRKSLRRGGRPMRCTGRTTQPRGSNEAEQEEDGCDEK